MPEAWSPPWFLVQRPFKWERHSWRARSPAPAPFIARQECRSDRKSTRLNSSHLVISYAVFCLKKKKKTNNIPILPTIMKHVSESLRHDRNSATCTFTFTRCTHCPHSATYYGAPYTFMI